MKFKSELLSLNEIVERNYFFRVPIYQRQYVWGNDQVETLVEDLISAYAEDREIYYLGGVIVVKAEQQSNRIVFDLIDGQQRFTTLWLMGDAWQGALQPFTNGSDKHARITFAIRKDVADILRAGDDTRVEDAPATFEFLGAARKRIDAYAKGETIDFEAFCRFIFERVTVVLTFVPRNVDLNKLFTTINNRGVQLQHHEILKARLLAVLDEAERDRYAALWDAAAMMDEYIERAFRQVRGVPAKELLSRRKTGQGEPFVAAESALGLLAAAPDRGTDATTLVSAGLEQILAEGQVADSGASQNANADNDRDESFGVRSIVTFPMLLQHTLRIWLHQRGKPDLAKILDKELLEIFQKAFLEEYLAAEHVKSFIRLLWEVRFLFDAHIIKWVTEDQEEWHTVARIGAQDDTKFRRDKRMTTEDQGFALLQSMLYHSQQITTQYWLTPLLAYLHRHPDLPGKDVYAYLRHLDNNLLCSKDQNPLIERSRAFLDDPWLRAQLDPHELSHELNKLLGTDFPHYWFYKLEFVLWYSGNYGNESQRRDFRITAKNSIEHVAPQHRQGIDPNTVSAGILNCFGNLALVSRGINSEYGNKPFNEKRQHFWNRNARRVDSLKMLDIYSNETWNDDIARQHEAKMIGAIRHYLEQDHIH